jgi:hypothetical protein
MRRIIAVGLVVDRELARWGKLRASPTLANDLPHEDL